MSVGERDGVILALHDPAWASLFASERARLLEAAPGAIVDVHHVGSTAVPGIVAKPVIDILVVLRRFLCDEEITAVSEPVYEYRGEYGIPGRQYFSRRTEPAFHIHAFLETNQEVERMLRFRDYLIANSEAAQEYEALKLRLANDLRLSREEYTRAKEAFVRRIDRLAARSGALGSS